MTALNLDQLKPGMILEKDVKNSSGTILVPKGTRLTEKHIKTLKAWGSLNVVKAKSSAGAGQDPKDSKLIKEIQRKVELLFCRSNRDHPAIQIMMRLSVADKLEQHSREKGPHAAEPV